MRKEKQTGRFRIVDEPFGHFTVEAEVEVTEYTDPLFMRPKKLSVNKVWRKMDKWFNLAYPWWDCYEFLDIGSAKLFMDRAIELFNGQTNYTYSDNRHAPTS